MKEKQEEADAALVKLTFAFADRGYFNIAGVICIFRLYTVDAELPDYIQPNIEATDLEEGAQPLLFCTVRSAVISFGRLLVEVDAVDMLRIDVHCAQITLAHLYDMAVDVVDVRAESADAMSEEAEEHVALPGKFRLH